MILNGNANHFAFASFTVVADDDYYLIQNAHQTHLMIRVNAFLLDFLLVNLEMVFFIG
jgi:hypothetical protein